MRLALPISAATMLLAACGGGGDGGVGASPDGAHATAVSASSKSCDNRVDNTFDKLLECVTLPGVRARQSALQAIADANGGTPGCDASVAYLRSAMADRGQAVDCGLPPRTAALR